MTADILRPSKLLLIASSSNINSHSNERITRRLEVRPLQLVGNKSDSSSTADLATVLINQIKVKGLSVALSDALLVLRLRVLFNLKFWLIMIVTINTDASFCETNSLGTYAFWVVSNRFKIMKAGVLRKKVKRPEIAEFRCIINALHMTLKQDCRDVGLIVINTDCLNVVHLLNDDKKAIIKYQLGSWGRHLCHLFNSEIAMFRYRGKVEIRHVRAHTDDIDKRSYVNNWCDTEAKKMLYGEISRRNEARINKYYK